MAETPPPHVGKEVFALWTWSYHVLCWLSVSLAAEFRTINQTHLPRYESRPCRLLPHIRRLNPLRIRAQDTMWKYDQRRLVWWVPMLNSSSVSICQRDMWCVSVSSALRQLRQEDYEIEVKIITTITIQVNRAACSWAPKVVLTGISTHLCSQEHNLQQPRHGSDANAHQWKSKDANFGTCIEGINVLSLKGEGNSDQATAKRKDITLSEISNQERQIPVSPFTRFIR